MRQFIQLSLWMLAFPFLYAGSIQEQLPIRLKGIFEFDGSILFSVESTQGRGSAWVGLQRPFAGGRIVEYDRKDDSIIYSNEAGSYRVSLTKPSEFASSIVFTDQLSGEYSSHAEELKPFDQVPELVKTMPASSLVEFLDREGYEIPDRIIIQARSDTILQAIQNSENEKSSTDLDEDIYLGPRAPTYTTSMTREEKIARKIVGYIQ